jgi:hypothetical protein
MLPVVSLIALKSIIKKQRIRGSRSIPYHIYWRWTWVLVRRHETNLLHLISVYVAPPINSSLSNKKVGTISKSQRRPHAAISWSSCSTCRRSDVFTSWIRTGLSCVLRFHKIIRCWSKHPCRSIVLSDLDCVAEILNVLYFSIDVAVMSIRNQRSWYHREFHRRQQSRRQTVWWSQRSCHLEKFAKSKWPSSFNHPFQ